MAIVFTPYLRKAAREASRVAPIPLPRPSEGESEFATEDRSEMTSGSKPNSRPDPRTAALAVIVGLGGFLTGRWLVRRLRGGQSDTETTAR